MDTPKRTILVVDDEGDLREVVSDLLRSRGYGVVCAEDGIQAIQRFKESNPDLVILDLMLPDMSGFDICKKIKAAAARHIPVILLTARTDIGSLVGGLGDAGADDYVAKPFRPEELLARIGAELRLKDLHDVIQKQNEALTVLSMTDDLTGLYNRRYLTRKLDDCISRLRRHDGALSCALLDLDRFKEVNDAHGHLAGDEVLRKFAQILKNSLGPNGICGRWGGDEFLVLMTSDAAAIARSAASSSEDMELRKWSDRIIEHLQNERLLRIGDSHSPTASAGHGWPSAGSDRDVTEPAAGGRVQSVGLSGGGATVQGPDPRLDPVQIIADLDALVYRAKQNGRNRFAFAEFNSAGRGPWAGSAESHRSPDRAPVVFVLEDDTDICSIIRDMLSRHRISTEIFQETPAMMRALESKTPDLILLDLKLSDGDGMDVCRKLRGRKDTAKTKIAFLTAFTSQEMREKAIACGADAFLVKPFTYAKFVEEVNRLLGIRV